MLYFHHSKASIISWSKLFHCCSAYVEQIKILMLIFTFRSSKGVVLCLVAQSCLTLCNPKDCSAPGSSACGILQARILEWVPCPPPGDLPNPENEPRSPTWQGDSLLPEPPEKPKNTGPSRWPHCNYSPSSSQRGEIGPCGPRNRARTGVMQVRHAPWRDHLRRNPQLRNQDK